MKSGNFFILRRKAKISTKKQPGILGYGGTLRLHLSKKDNVPISAGTFAFPVGYHDYDDKGVWACHKVAEIVYVLTGGMHYNMITPDGKVRKDFDVGKGDLLYVAPGTWHRGHAIGKEPYSGILFVTGPLDGDLPRKVIKDERLPAAKSHKARR